MNKQFPRRDFIKISGFAAAAGMLAPKFAGAFRSEQPAKIALQLYTLRNQMKMNIPDCLRFVAQTGFEAVETAFWPDDVSIKQAGKYLKDAGLVVASAHVALPDTEQNKAIMLETAETFNCKKMIWHGWPEDKRYSSMEGTKELVGLYNEANRFAHDHGLEFGLHNHWWEYRNKVDGKFVYQVLLESTDPQIFFEIDTYWVKVAGHDPAKIVAEFGKRAPLLHIKDGPARWTDSLPADKPEPMVAAGKGTQNFPAIVKAANGNTEWMVLEMDVTATDVFAAIKDSYHYLVANHLAQGRKPA
jgi:sugar phosphate isomerase/epimerase